MTVRNSMLRWGIVSQLLHWIVAILVLTQVVLIFSAKALPRGPEPFALLNDHKSIGITIFVVVLIRLLWRLANPVPKLPSSMKRHERFLAHFTHVALYVILLAMPLAGWLGSAAHAFPVKWFGLFVLPSVLPKDVPLSHALFAVHSFLALLLGIVLILHVGAALRHHFVLKDDVLRRMLPSRSSASARVQEAHRDA